MTAPPLPRRVPGRALAEEPLAARHVAALFGVTEKTVWRWARDGKIPSFRTPGGHHRFRLPDIAAALRDGQP
jgi:excisionase family DNA binding protein